MPKIYIIRHGETVWNTERRFQGWMNSDLTEKGQDQAELAGQFLKDKKIQQIFYSPLKRVQDTLSIVQKVNLNLETIPTIGDDRLKECNYGDIDGIDEKLINTSLLLQGIDRKDPAIKFNFKFHNGESYKDQLIRVLDFVSYYSLQVSKFNALIVCHMGTMKYLSIALQNKLDIDNIYKATTWRPGNNTIVIFDTETKEVEIVEL